MAQRLRDAVAATRSAYSTESDHMCTRATFAGLPMLGAAALFALGCADSVTSEHRSHANPAFALSAVPVAGHTLYVLSGLSYPFGLAFRGDTMYFAEETAVQRLDPGATTPVTLVSNLPSGGHVTRTIAFGPDNLLYVAIGSSCNVCDDALPRAAVTRYNLDGSNPHTFATGLRNSVGMAFHPTTGELWANNNDRDDL